MPTPADRLAAVLIRVGAVAIVVVTTEAQWLGIDRFDVPKELVLHATALAAGGLAMATAPRVRLRSWDALLLAAFVLGCASAALVAHNQWAAVRSLGISGSGLVMFWTAGHLSARGLRGHLVMTAVMVLVAVSGAVLLDAFGVWSSSLPGRAPAGPLGNRNYAAHLLVIAIPAATVAGTTIRRRALVAGVSGVLAMSAMALVLTRCRGAWLAALVVLVAVAGTCAFALRRRPQGDRVSRARAALLAAAFAGGIALAFVVPNDLEWGSPAPFRDTARSLLDYENGTGKGRLTQYGNTLMLARDHWLLGVGPGQWPTVYPRYARAGDGTYYPNTWVPTPPRATSDAFGLLAERGAVGALLVFLALADLAWSGARGAGRRRDSAQRRTSLALLGTVLATLVVGLFDCVIQLAAPTFVAFLLLGALAPARATPRHAAPARRPRPGLAFALAVVVGAPFVQSALHVHAARLSLDASTPAEWDHIASLSLGHWRTGARAARAWLDHGNCDRARSRARATLRLNPEYGLARELIALCDARESNARAHVCGPDVQGCAPRRGQEAAAPSPGSRPSAARGGASRSPGRGTSLASRGP